MGTGMKWLAGLSGLLFLAVGVGEVAGGRFYSGAASGLLGFVCVGFPLLAAGSRDRTSRTEMRDGQMVRVYPFKRMAGIVLLQWAFALAGVAMALGADQMAAGGSRPALEYRLAGIVCAVVFGLLGVRSLPYLFREAFVALRPDGLELRSAMKFFVPWPSVRAAWETRYRRNDLLALSVQPGAPVEAGSVTRLLMAYTHRAYGWDLTLNPAFHDPALVEDVYDNLGRYGAPGVAIGEHPRRAHDTGGQPSFLSP
jgi:hypothetical protein